MQPELKTNFPIVKSFYDYHEAEGFKDALNLILKPKVKRYEFAFNCRYYFVFYIGKRPNQEQILEAMKNQGFKNQEIRNLEWNSSINERK